MTQLNLDLINKWPVFGWPLSSTSIAALSVYAVGGFDPKLALDFIGNTYKTGGADSTLANSVTHARAGQATMVDSDGLLKWDPHNLLIRSEQLNLWSQVGTGSVVVDNAVAPDGTTTAATFTIGSTNFHRYILSSLTYTAGDKITFSFYVRSDTVTTLPFGINGGTNGNNNPIFSSIAVTSTWQLVEFEFTVIGNDASLYYIIGKQSHNPVDCQLGDVEIWHPHVYRSNLGGMANNPAQSTGFETYVPTSGSAVYLPRVGHHIYNGSAWVNEGILHESEARTNLMTDSGDLTGADWSWSGGLIVGTVTTGSPFGAYQTISPRSSNAGTGHEQRYQIGKSITSGSTYVTSSLVKYSAGSGWFILIPYDTGQGNRRAWFDLQNGVVGTKHADVLDYGMIDYGDGWWLCWASANVTSTSGGLSVEMPNGDGVRTHTATDVILIAGSQFEQGATPSSYIPTSGSAVTRAAETLTVPAANLPYSSTNMSIQMDGRMTYADNGLNREVNFHRWLKDGYNFIQNTLRTNGNYEGLLYYSQRGASETTEKGVSSFANPAYFTPDINIPFNIAARHGATFINGAEGGTALTANTTPTSLPDLSSTYLALGLTFMGTIGQFRMWDEDLTDTGIAEAST